MLPSGQSEDFGIFAGAAAEIAALPSVERKPHTAKRIMPFQALMAVAEKKGWRVALVRMRDILDPEGRESPEWVLRVIRNPADPPAQWQIAHATSDHQDVGRAVAEMTSVCFGKVRAWA